MGGSCIVSSRFRRFHAGWRTKRGMKKQERLALLNEAVHAIPPGSTYKGKVSTLADAVFALTSSVTGADPTSDFTNTAVLEFTCPMPMTVCGVNVPAREGLTFDGASWIQAPPTASGSCATDLPHEGRFRTEQEAIKWYDECKGKSESE